MKKYLFVLFLICAHYQTHAQITFQKSFGGLGSESCVSVQQTSDGGYIMGGYTWNFGSGSDEFYLIRTDMNGDTIWTKTIGGLSGETGSSIFQCTDGGFIMTGVTQSFGSNNGSFRVYLIKTDAGGNLLWSKTFGGVSNDFGTCVKQTIDGGFIVLGNTSLSGMGSELYLIKTDANGDSLWTKTLGSSSNDIGRYIQQTTDGGYIIVGSTGSFGAGDYDVYLIKTDSIGNPLWSKTYGGVDEERGNYVQQTTDGGYCIVGYTHSFGTGMSYDLYLIKTNSNGNLLWSRAFGGLSYDTGYFGQQTTDGGYIVVGNSLSFVSPYSDVYFIKTDSNGNLIWNKTYGGPLRDEASSAQQTSDGGYIIGGLTLNFGANIEDIYLIKTDANGNSGCNQGNPQTTITIPATQVANVATIVNSTNTNITNPVSFVGSGGIMNNICTNVGINEVATDNNFASFPNPSAGNFIISFKKTIVKGNISIFNILGENVFTENIINKSQQEINIIEVSSGIYFAKVFDGEKYYCNKIIIEQN